MPASGLESANFKLVRATKHLSEINDVIRRAASVPNSYEIIKDANGKEVVNFLIDPPPDIAIIAGEIVYQFRSALDHLAFDLVKRNPSGGTLPANWVKNCSFPLWLEIPKEQIKCGNTAPPLPYNCFESILPGISKAAFAFIEGIQPYRTGPGVHNVIRIIAKLANIDKHRHLYPIIPRLAVHQEVAHTEGRYAGFRGTSTVGGLKQGAEIELPEFSEGDGTVYMKRSFTPYVTFNEIVGAGPDTLESQNVLEVCLEQLKTVVIPAFTNLLNNP